MKPRRAPRRSRTALAALALVAVAGCGDDGAEDAEAAPDSTAFCALAQEDAGNEDLPSPERIEEYLAAAPAEVADVLPVVAATVEEARDGGIADLLALVAEDDAEAAFAELNRFQADECGMEADGPVSVSPDEPEDGAAVVDVEAFDYGYEMADTVAAGRTSFVLANRGEEAHFMILFRAAEGQTIEESLESDSAVDGGFASDLAAPGGEDVEVGTADLEPGEYALVCFLPSAEGPSHFDLGMVKPFTVA